MRRCFAPSAFSRVGQIQEIGNLRMALALLMTRRRYAASLLLYVTDGLVIRATPSWNILLTRIDDKYTPAIPYLVDVGSRGGAHFYRWASLAGVLGRSGEFRRGAR